MLWVVLDSSADALHAPHWPLQVRQDKEEGGCPRKLLWLSPPAPWNGCTCSLLSRPQAGCGFQGNVALACEQTPQFSSNKFPTRRTFHKPCPTSAGLCPSTWPEGLVKCFPLLVLSQVAGETAGMVGDVAWHPIPPSGCRARDAWFCCGAALSTAGVSWPQLAGHHHGPTGCLLGPESLSAHGCRQVGTVSRHLASLPGLAGALLSWGSGASPACDATLDFVSLPH